MLGKIIANKKKEVASLKRIKPLAVLKKEVLRLKRKRPRFLQALRKGNGISVIAEIKRRSPSQGVLRTAFDPVKIAQSYKEAGARALSVLTDKKFFGGGAVDLKKVRRAVTLPILRKDFLIDEYQIYESRLLGADAVLLIAALLTREKLRRFRNLARRLGLDALVEVHTQAELKKTLAIHAKLIGINNRNLKTFTVDIRTTEKLVKNIPRALCVVSESGIQNHGEILFLKKLGVRAVLVGESLLTKKNVKKALSELRGTGYGQG